MPDPSLLVLVLLAGPEALLFKELPPPVCATAVIPCECEASCAVDKVALAVEPPTVPVTLMFVLVLVPTFPLDATVFAPPVDAKALVPDLPIATLS